MTSCPGDHGSIRDTSKDSNKTLQDHGTSKHLISEVTTSISEDVDEIWVAFQSIPEETRALVDTIVIYVENHHGLNRDSFILQSIPGGQCQEKMQAISR